MTAVRGVGFVAFRGAGACRLGRQLLTVALVMSVPLAVVSAGGMARAALPPGCSSSGSTVTCPSAAAGEHPFTVPAGVTSVHVVAVGGRGGTASASLPGIGGFGAVVSGELTGLRAGQVLYVEVAGNAPNATAGTGQGGGGGGASDVRTASCAGPCPGNTASLESRLIVAAGGGGGGGTCGNITAGGNGGDAGQGGIPGTEPRRRMCGRPWWRRPAGHGDGGRERR